MQFVDKCNELKASFFSAKNLKLEFCKLTNPSIGQIVQYKQAALAAIDGYDALQSEILALCKSNLDPVDRRKGCEILSTFIKEELNMGSV